MERALDHLYETSVKDRSDIADACRDIDLPVSQEFRDKIEKKYDQDLDDITMMQGSSDVLRDVFQGLAKTYKGE